jgi:hypothetical protein
VKQYKYRVGIKDRKRYDGKLSYLEEDSEEEELNVVQASRGKQQGDSRHNVCFRMIINGKCEIPEKCKYSHSLPEVQKEREEMIERMKLLNGAPTKQSVDASSRVQSQDARKRSDLPTSSSNLPPRRSSNETPARQDFSHNHMKKKDAPG